VLKVFDPNAEDRNHVIGGSDNGNLFVTWIAAPQPDFDRRSEASSGIIPDSVDHGGCIDDSDQSGKAACF